MINLVFYSKSVCLVGLFLTLSTYALQAQSQTKKINWQAVYSGFDQEGNPTQMLSGEGVFPAEQDHFIPYIQVKINGFSNDIRLKNVQTVDLSKDELQKLEPHLKLAKLQNSYQHGLENKRDVTLFLSPAIVKSGGGYKKITSYEIDYNLSQAPARAVSSARIQSGNSILASGDIYRVGVSREGIYKIDAAFLASIGLNIQGIDPRNLAIYGNGGQLLPQANSAPRIQDLYENSIYAVGESDGQFDPGDYFLFYARGPHPFFYNQISAVFQRERNVFCDTAYYFIKIKDTPAKRLQVQPSLTATGTSFTEFDDRLIHETDQFNYLKSGRLWVGESFNLVPSRSFSFNIPGMVSGATMRAIVAVAGRSSAPTSTSSVFTTQIGSTTLGTQTLPGNGGVDYGVKARISTAYYTINQNVFGGGSSVVFNLSFSKGASTAAEGHLDYILVNTRRRLELYGNMTSFRVTASTFNPTANYSVGNMTSGNLIWDVTNPLEPVLIQHTLNQTKAEFTVPSDTLREFVALHPSNHPTPVFVNKVVNQNLRAMQATELIIIAPPIFKNQAQSYANFRAQSMGISSSVVTTHDIYQEFSSGGQDVVAIRDFLKMMYDKPGSTLKYLLLYGDASFDFKYTTQNNTNFVPTYPSFESLSDLSSYCSDDYYGFLDDNEGNWNESGPLIPHFMDISIGRLPIRNFNEASNALAKIQLYESLPALGIWRNRVTFMADHKPQDGQYHLDECERFSRQVEAADSAFISNKIYLDAFNRVASPNGLVAPDAINQVSNAAINGSLLVTYYGHGNTTQLSANTMLNLDQVNGWPTFNNLPFWVTATCDFGKFDDPAITSGSELLLQRPNSGGIGAFTTSRPVFTTVNSSLLNVFFNEVFNLQVSNPIVGDIYKETKNKASTGIGGRNLLILGDPTLRLAIPREVAKVTSIVNLNTGAPADTLNALSVIQLSGEVVTRAGGQLMSNFNGQVNIVVYDAPSKIKSQGYGTTNSTGQPNTRTFTQWDNFVFNGQATVINGTFSVQFIVPLQISYSGQPGKINLYARQANSTIDAHGHRSEIIIGGSDTSVILDNKPPLITLYMDDESFVSGGTTGNNTILLARFSDDQGIALGSLPGQQIEGIMNRNEPIVLNEHYLSKENNFKEGSLDYPLQGLSPGNYTIKVKARDTHNNPGEASIEFVVASNESLSLNNIFNYPNPFSDYTLFHFDHNKAGSDLDVMLEVFTVSGRLIKTLTGYYPASKTRISDLAWNARDDFGDKLAKGVYIYKLSVRTGAEKKQEFQKLVILN